MQIFRKIPSLTKILGTNMDRNLLENLSNLTGLPVAQLLEKLGRIDVVDNPFEKADGDRIPRVGTARGGGATGGNASVRGAGTATGGNAVGGNATLTSPGLPSINTNTNNVSVSGTGVSNAGAGGGNSSFSGAPAPRQAPAMSVGNGLSAGAANGGPLPSTTPIRANAMTGNNSGAGGQNAVNMQVGNGLSAGAANGGPLPSTTGNAAGAAASSPRGGGGSQAYQLGGVKEGFWGGVNQLASANNISNPNQLSVGQQIKMPDGSSYTVRSGDTLSGIYQNRATAAPAAPAAGAPAAGAPAAGAAGAPAAFGRVGANQASATRNPFAADGGNVGPGFAQNRRDPNAPAVTAPPSTTGRTGTGGEQVQPGLDRYQAATPASAPASAPIDPMTNGERRQGNQFLASSPYEETASPPPEIAAPRPGESVYPPGTSEKTDGLPPDTNPYPYGQDTPYSPTSTDQRTNPREFRTSTANKARQAADSQAFAQESQRMAPPDLTRSLKKKGAWFSSATHPIIRGY